MGSLAARSLVGAGVGSVTILGRRPERAQRLAGRIGARHGSIDALPEALRSARVVVSSTASTAPVITAGVVRDAASGPMFLLDLAVPRDIEPEAGMSPGSGWRTSTISSRSSPRAGGA